MMASEEVDRLIRSGIARDGDHARQILSKRERADTFLFYTNASAVKNSFPELVAEDEKVYNGTNILVGQVPSGALERVKRLGVDNPNRLAMGRLREFVSKDESDAKMVGWINNFAYEEREGIFLSPYRNTEDFRAKGGKTFDERHNLHRIEFDPIKGDYILGMFAEWDAQPISRSAHLVLHIPRRHVIELSGN